MIMLSIKGSCRHNPANTIIKSPVEYLSLSAASSLSFDHSSIRFNHSVITADLNILYKIPPALPAHLRSLRDKVTELAFYQQILEFSFSLERH